MGLEFTEMMFKVEERFHIDEIDERDLYDVVSPRKFIDVIMKYIDKQTRETCINVKRFNYVRRALNEAFGTRKRSVKLDSDFADLIPNHSENHIWRTLQEELIVTDWDWPSLQFSKINQLISLILYILGVVLLTRYLFINTHFIFAIVGTLIGMLVIWLLFKAVERRLGRNIPNEYRTVKSIFPLIEINGKHRWTRQDIALEFRDIIISDYAFDPNKYHEDIDFIKDLGWG